MASKFNSLLLILLYYVLSADIIINTLFAVPSSDEMLLNNKNHDYEYHEEFDFVEDRTSIQNVTSKYSTPF